MRTHPGIPRLLLLPLCLGLLVVSVLAGTPLARADESSNLKNDTGHDTSKSTIANLSLGEYWWGAKIEPGDLEGKVVLFEIWGS